MWAGLFTPRGLLLKSLQAWLGTHWCDTLLKGGDTDAVAPMGLHRGSALLAEVEVNETELGTLPMPCTTVK